MSDDMIDVDRPYSWTDNRLTAGLVAAFAATFLATMFGEWFFALGWVPFSFNTLNAEVWATNFQNLSGFFAVTAKTSLSPDFVYFLGMFAHYGQGMMFGLIFALLVYPNLPGPMRTGNNLVKGLIWGWTLMLISDAFVMPLMYGTGYFFSYWGSAFKLGQGNLIFDNFVWHSIYGFVLGMFFNPTPKSSSGMALPGRMSWGSPVHYGQIVLGWIIIAIGGYIATIGLITSKTGSELTNAWGGAGQADASWGVLVGLIGLIIATMPSIAKMLNKK